MDEIEGYKLIKKLIKIFVILLLPILIIGLIKIIFGENIIFNIIFNIFTYIEFWVLMILIPLTLYVFARNTQNSINSKINISKNKEYIRDIEIKYSPAIISLILDLQISYFKDYTAMILYLCYRKYIEICKIDNEIKFKIIQENVQELNPHEQYVYRCINQNGFNETKFYNYIIEDAKNLGLISVNNGKIQRTSKGEEEAKLWRGFKNYLHDYTLISDKNIEHIAILDEYIPYAISLDEAKNIEKFISDDDSYRNLIYKFYNNKDGRYKNNDIQ